MTVKESESSCQSFSIIRSWRKTILSLEILKIKLGLLNTKFYAAQCLLITLSWMILNFCIISLRKLTALRSWSTLSNLRINFLNFSSTVLEAFLIFTILLVNRVSQHHSHALLSSTLNFLIISLFDLFIANSTIRFLTFKKKHSLCEDIHLF